MALPFLPTQLSGCVLWLTASRGVTLNGATVSAWANQGTLGGSFTQGTGSAQPTFSAAGGANSQPCLTFDGGDYLVSSLASSAWTTLHSTAHTFFLVLKSESASLPGNEFYGLFGTADAAARGVNVFWENRSGTGTNSLNYRVSNGSNIFTITQDNSLVRGTTQILELAWEHGISGNDGTALRNGTTITSADSTGSPSASAPQMTMQLGAYGVSFTQGFRGNYCEMIAYSRALTASERGAVRRYLGARYGITVS